MKIYPLDFELGWSFRIQLSVAKGLRRTEKFNILVFPVSEQNRFRSSNWDNFATFENYSNQTRMSYIKHISQGFWKKKKCCWERQIDGQANIVSFMFGLTKVHVIAKIATMQSRWGTWRQPSGPMRGFEIFGENRSHT